MAIAHQKLAFLVPSEYRLRDDDLDCCANDQNGPFHDFRVYVINTKYSYEEMTKIYKKLANKFWHLLPKELKSRQCWLY